MNKPDQAFVLAAGHGKRMLPLTAQTPKPLVKIKEKPLLDYTYTHLKKAGVKKIVLNAHHLGEQIEHWAKTKNDPDIHVIQETELLDTGGGLINALDHFDDKPFYVVAGDAFWSDHPDKTSLDHLAETWDNEKMDILMVLEDTHTMALTKGVGDYHLKENGQAHRALDKNGNYMFTNIRINHPRIFANIPTNRFSFLDLMDAAQKDGRLYGLKHKGQWHHISTAEDLNAVNENL